MAVSGKNQAAPKPSLTAKRPGSLGATTTTRTARKRIDDPTSIKNAAMKIHATANTKQDQPIDKPAPASDSSSSKSWFFQLGIVAQVRTNVHPQFLVLAILVILCAIIFGKFLTTVFGLFRLARMVLKCTILLLVGAAISSAIALPFAYVFSHQHYRQVKDETYGFWEFVTGWMLTVAAFILSCIRRSTVSDGNDNGDPPAWSEHIWQIPRRTRFGSNKRVPLSRENIYSACLLSVATYITNKLQLQKFFTPSENPNRFVHIIPRVYKDITYIVAWINDDETYIAFRGTDHMRDVMTDLNVKGKVGNGGSTHSGFTIDAEKVLADVKQILMDRCARGTKKHKLILCGHSLGGARAHCCHLSIKRGTGFFHNNFDVVSIGFGAPYFGCPNIAAEIFDQNRDINFVTVVNRRDPVPGILNTIQTLAVLREWYKNNPAMIMLLENLGNAGAMILKSVQALYPLTFSIQQLKTQAVSVLRKTIFRGGAECVLSYFKKENIEKAYTPKALDHLAQAMNIFTPAGTYIFLSTPATHDQNFGSPEQGHLAPLHTTAKQFGQDRVSFKVVTNIKLVDDLLSWKDDFKVADVARHSAEGYLRIMMSMPEFNVQLDLLAPVMEADVADPHENMVAMRPTILKKKIMTVITRDIAQKMEELLETDIRTADGRFQAASIICSGPVILRELDPIMAKLGEDAHWDVYLGALQPWKDDFEAVWSNLTAFVWDASKTSAIIVEAFTELHDDDILYMDLFSHHFRNEGAVLPGRLSEWATELKNDLATLEERMKNISNKIGQHITAYMVDAQQNQQWADNAKTRKFVWVATAVAGALAAPVVAPLAAGAVGVAGVVAATGVGGGLWANAKQAYYAQKEQQNRQAKEDGEDVHPKILDIAMLMTVLATAWTHLAGSFDSLVEQIKEGHLKIGDVEYQEHVEEWENLKELMAVLNEELRRDA
ncbi:hypothetical protein HDV00_005663 [Rhizophlyctis rosea]|nr:hypothetical protein HDV00_005663 [Rhizophlyctis rosea]